MSTPELTLNRIHPIKDEEFVSWLKQPASKYFIGLLVAFHRQEHKTLVRDALEPGNTDHLKGEIKGLARFLKPFEFLAETETDTGSIPETETDTAKE